MRAIHQSSAFVLATGILLKSSVVARYWKKWSVRLVCSVVWKNYRENSCLLVFYHVNYLPFDQCFPSLWTPQVFCKTKKIDKILKTKPKWKLECPHSVDVSAVLSCCWPLLLKAIHCSFLLHAVTEAVSVKMAPLECTCPLLQADFTRFGKREWGLCTHSLEELIHLQSRHRGPPCHPHPWCVRPSAVSDKAYCIQISFCMRWKDLAVALRYLCIPAHSIWLRAAEWGGGGPITLNSLLSQWKEVG